MGSQYGRHAEFLKMFDRKTYRHEYYLKNKDKSLKQGLAWRAKNRNHLRLLRRRQGKQFRARYAAQIAAYMKKYAAERYKERRLFIDACKSRPCSDCNNEYPPYVMQFDHIRGRKSFQISTGTSCNLDRLKKEIEKCDVVCSNCHCTRTWKRRHVN